MHQFPFRDCGNGSVWLWRTSACVTFCHGGTSGENLLTLNHLNSIEDPEFALRARDRPRNSYCRRPAPRVASSIVADVMAAKAVIYSELKAAFLKRGRYRLANSVGGILWYVSSFLISIVNTAKPYVFP
jgi:hypothetical protein